MTIDYDKKVDELIKIAQEKKSAVLESEKIIGKAWITNCSLPIPFQTKETFLNIQTAEVNALLDAITSLLSYQAFRNKACEVLDVKSDDLYHGFTFENWISDCKKRVKVILIKEQKTQLNTIESRLNTLISPERKRLLELENIENLLK